jgi:hypothetical protein
MSSGSQIGGLLERESTSASSFSQRYRRVPSVLGAAPVAISPPRGQSFEQPRGLATYQPAIAQDLAIVTDAEHRRIGLGVTYTSSELQKSSVRHLEYVFPASKYSSASKGVAQRFDVDVMNFARRHGVVGSLFVACSVIKQECPGATVQVSLESDPEAALTIISFVLKATGQTLDQMIEADSRLHDQLFHSLPTSALRFLSFRFDFD